MFLSNRSTKEPIDLKLQKLYLLRLLKPSIQVLASYSSPFYFFFDFFIAIAIALPARPIRPITTTCGILSLPFNTALI